MRIRRLMLSLPVSASRIRWREEVCAGIERQEFRGKLSQHVVGDDEQGLARQTQPLQFHRGGHHRVSFPRTYDVCQQAVRRLQDAPDGGALVRMQNDGRAGAGQREVIAVEAAQTHMVELVVVFADQPLAPIVVAPNPLLEALLDLLLLVAGSFGGRAVDDIAVALRIAVIDRRHAQIERVFEQFQCAAAVGGGPNR